MLLYMISLHQKHAWLPIGVESINFPPAWIAPGLARLRFRKVWHKLLLKLCYGFGRLCVYMSTAHEIRNYAHPG